MASNNIQQEGMLPVGTILRGSYRIDSYLSSGGFGNTYKVTNVEFDEQYAIKEFFMRGVNQRDAGQNTVTVSNTANRTSFEEQREKFKKEARRLRQMQNKHLVRVHDLFEENGTAYYVMDFIDGESLADRLKRCGRPIAESKVRDYLLQILDALEEIHNSGFQHLDLKPANIMVDKQGQVTLIDFGASKQMRSDGGVTASTAICYTPGYAPREQMEQNYSKFGPWTDLYGLGATLYNILTNHKPPMPSDIDDEGEKAFSFPSSVSDEMRSYILWLMQPNRMKRPQKVMRPTWKANEETKVENKDTKQSTPSEPSNDETIVGKPAPKNVPKSEQQTKPTPLGSSPLASDDDDNSGSKIFWWIFLPAAIIILMAVGINNCEGTSSNGYVESKAIVINLTFGGNILTGIYTGNLKDGKPDGNGKVGFYGGGDYIGDFRNGEITGHGVYKKNGQKVYVGTYVNGKRDGSGVEYSDGVKVYVGNYQNGLRNGQGTEYSSDGEEIFRGTYLNGDKQNGYGKETGTNPDGETWEYEGEYRNGARNGKGTMKWSNGDKYDGDWKDGERTGQGTYTWSEKRWGYGYKYVGEFKNGEFHGKGVMYFVGAGSETHYYENGKQIK